LLHFCKAEVIFVHNPGCKCQIIRNLAERFPRKIHNSIEIVPDNRSFCRQRRHQLEFFQFGLSFLPGLVRQTFIGDLLFQLPELFGVFVFFAEFLLNNFQLFIQIVFLLIILDLLLDAFLDLPVELDDFRFSQDNGEKSIQPIINIKYRQNILLVFKLYIKITDNCINKQIGV